MESESVEVEIDAGARIEEIFQAFEGKGAAGADREATFLFRLEGEGGGVHLLRISPEAARWERNYAGADAAEVDIKLSVEDFLSIADGNFDGRLAVASERVEISGDLDLAEKFLGWVEPEEAG
jgi:hypothetical protein